MIKLAAFDLDSTLIDRDTDAYLSEIARINIPPSIERIYVQRNWPQRMNKAFEFMKDDLGIEAHHILEVIARVKVTI